MNDKPKKGKKSDFLSFFSFFPIFIRSQKHTLLKNDTYTLPNVQFFRQKTEKLEKMSHFLSQNRKWTLSDPLSKKNYEFFFNTIFCHERFAEISTNRFLNKHMRGFRPRTFPF